MDGKGELGQQLLEEAIKVFEKVLNREPNDLTNQQLLAICYRLLADRLIAVPDLEGALDPVQRARSILERLTIRSPDVAEFQATLGTVYMDLAELQRRRDKPRKSLAMFDLAANHLLKLADRYPNVPDHRRDYAVTLREMGTIELKLGDIDEGRYHLDESVTYLQALVDEFPDNEDFASQLAESKKAVAKASSP